MTAINFTSTPKQVTIIWIILARRRLFRKKSVNCLGRKTNQQVWSFGLASVHEKRIEGRPNHPNERIVKGSSCHSYRFQRERSDRNISQNFATAIRPRNRLFENKTNFSKSYGTTRDDQKATFPQIENFFPFPRKSRVFPEPPDFNFFFLYVEILGVKSLLLPVFGPILISFLIA